MPQGLRFDFWYLKSWKSYSRQKVCHSAQLMLPSFYNSAVWLPVVKLQNCRPFVLYLSKEGQVSWNLQTNSEWRGLPNWTSGFLGHFVALDQCRYIMTVSSKCLLSTLVNWLILVCGKDFLIDCRLFFGFCAGSRTPQKPKERDALYKKVFSLWAFWT